MPRVVSLELARLLQQFQHVFRVSWQDFHLNPRKTPRAIGPSVRVVFFQVGQTTGRRSRDFRPRAGGGVSQQLHPRAQHRDREQTE